jgi:hypothetical protein
MKDLERRFISVVCQLIVLGAGILLTPCSNYGQKTPSPTPSVKVVNSPSEPVPVIGSVSVTNPVSVSGTVNLGNTVSFKLVIPDGAFSTWTELVSGPDPAGTNYAITSITARNDGTNSTFVRLEAFYGTVTNSCLFDWSTGNGETILGPPVFVPAGQTIHLTFPQPYILKAQDGSNACLRARPPQNLDGLHIGTIVVGYRF